MAGAYFGWTGKGNIVQQNPQIVDFDLGFFCAITRAAL
jgi:hypothetical protein